jgi:beta-galactosidase
VPHAGPDSARFREVTALGAALRAIGEVAGAPVAADVALLWDWTAWWACDLDSHPSSALRYVDAPHRWHRALTELGATVDVVHPAADLSAYRLVVVPTLYLCSDTLAARLANRHVLVTYFSGIVDEQDHVRLGGYPGAFRDLLGVRVEEFAPLRAPVTLDEGSRADLWSEVLTVVDADVVAAHSDGTPAITRKGDAWYVATRLDEAATAALARRVAEAAGVRLADGARPGVEIVRRDRYVFVLNRSDSPAEVPVVGTDLLTGASHNGKVTVDSGSAAVVREGA